MPWLLRSIVDLFNRLAAWYLNLKYGATARQLGRQPPTDEASPPLSDGVTSPPQGDGRRGFVIIEIDGLAYEYLRRAMKQGHMPYLSRLVISRRLRIAPWRCGLPSTTPASQAGIMYGNNWDIPGFRWYDKETQSSVLCKLPGPVRAIQQRISSGRPGLLRGGSSYTNMFDGDARLALFTLSALGRDRLFENVRGLGFLVLFALNPWRMIKLFFLSLWTWILYVVKRLVALVRPSTPHFTFLGPLLEIFNNIIFREVTTFSVMVDIYRAMPAIYAAYTGYDEIAHHFGADSREAFRALRGIDQQIRQIDRIRQLYESPGYDLYILSDHGMTPSVPFRRAFGQSLEQWIATYTGREVDRLASEGEDEGLSEARAYYLLEELRGLEERPHLRVPGRILRATRQELERRLLARAQEADWDLSRRRDIAVRDSGSLSHVYLNVSPEPLDLGEVALLHPGLLEALVEHPGIGLVVGRQDGETLILGEGGTLRIGRKGQHTEGKDPLAGFDDPGWAAQQIARLAGFPHAGDLILLGAWDGQRVISFEEQVASHGGLGGPQAQPFIAFPPRRGLAPRGIDNAEKVYALFNTYKEAELCHGEDHEQA